MCASIAEAGTLLFTMDKKPLWEPVVSNNQCGLIQKAISRRSLFLCPLAEGFTEELEARLSYKEKDQQAVDYA